MSFYNIPSTYYYSNGGSPEDLTHEEQVEYVHGDDNIDYSLYNSQLGDF
jgi:hypothetical protein